MCVATISRTAQGICAYVCNHLLYTPLQVATLGNRTHVATGMGGPGPAGYLDGANITLGKFRRYMLSALRMPAKCEL